MKIKFTILGLILGLFSYPAIVRASFLLFFQDHFSVASAATIHQANSQTLVLLEPNNSLSPSSTPPIVTSDGALWAEAGPLGTTADLSDSIGSDQISVYTAKPGDTIAAVAKMYDVSVNTVIWANNLTKGQALKPGQELVILPISGVEHTVKKGDTLKSVAKLYHADPTEIAQFNGLDQDGNLTVGSDIIIPDGEMGVPLTTSPSGKTVLVGSHGPALPSYGGYYLRPIVGGVKTQGIHGHNAVDLANHLGTPVMAAAAGTVLIARTGGWNGGYGNYVVINHPNGTQTVYGHLEKVLTTAGTRVDQGEEIGLLGTTGNSTGPHVHFEIHGAKNPF